MKNTGESILSLAVHKKAASIATPGLATQVPLTYTAIDTVDRADALYLLLEAIDASQRDAEAGITFLTGTIQVVWIHTPTEGDPYSVLVYIK